MQCRAIRMSRTSPEPEDRLCEISVHCVNREDRKSADSKSRSWRNQLRYSAPCWTIRRPYALLGHIISRTDGRSATDEAAFERSRGEVTIAYLNFCLKGHRSGQGQDKVQYCRFSLRLPLKPFHLIKRVENRTQCVQLIDEGGGLLVLLF